ncbi:hypothetical protein Lal_00018978 [Lupinus albus]|uniref:Uncharacterized protein n=1 Tax=Lupinus albus TaxID=3870 RepID=A0A6A4R526_LUPAL|nr:hypothetical protein Lalb_Chr01g0002981 [Lupinus albus]KAF1898858.1 hypothetical protein Lal_00018978 [Lupinus albus]
MSGLVDIWTRELSKLKEKGQSPIQHETSQGIQERERVKAVDKLIKFNKSRLLYSEASLSMLVECFSP